MSETQYVSVIFAVGALVAWDFVFQYGFRAKWYTHPFGRIYLGFMVVKALIMTTIVINLYWLSYPGREFFRELQYTMFVGGLIVLDLFLHLQLRKRDDRTKPVSDTGEVQPVERDPEVSQSDS